MDPNKRPDDMERITTPELAQAFIDEKIEEIRAQVGDKNVLAASTRASLPRCSSKPSASSSSAST